MGFLAPEFSHDIFVSYSHGDFDRDGASILKDWSAAFVRELEQELRQDPEFAQLSIFSRRG